MHESDRKRLEKWKRALLLAGNDLDQALAAGIALKTRGDEYPLNRALETALVVCYARAFTEDSRRFSIAPEYAPAEGQDKEIHGGRQAQNRPTRTPIRRTRAGQCPRAPFDRDEIFASVEWEEEWMPFPSRLAS